MQSPPSTSPALTNGVTSPSKAVTVTDETSSPNPRPTSKDASPAASSFLQPLIDAVLGFLSDASNETLGACLAVLAAATYLLLGRIGLVIIGVAGGVVLHATWDGSRNRLDAPAREEERRRKREAGIEVARRLLEWKASARPDEDATTHLNVKVYAAHGLNYANFGSETEAALNTFTDAVVKDYVHYWYDPIIPGEDTFPAYCRQTLVAFILSLSTHLQRKRPADAFLDFVTNASSMILVFLSELATALNASPNTPVEEAVSAYLKMKPDSSLSYMLNQESQKLKLADAAEDIIQAYVDSKSYNCPPMHSFLKEVLASLVLEYTVTYCSNPDWINDWIVYGLEESQTTKEVMDIVDAGVEGSKAGAKTQPKESTTEEKQPAKEREPPTKEVAVNQKASATQETPAKRQPDTISNPKKTPSNPSETLDGANSKDTKASTSAHSRKVSRAEEAMDEAMREARRLTQLILEEDERRAREEKAQQPATANDDTLSVANESSVQPTTPADPTSVSSQSNAEKVERRPDSAQANDDHVKDASNGPIITGTSSTANDAFLNFDQILASNTPTALLDTPDTPDTSESPDTARRDATPLTLHNAQITILDDSVPGERTSIKAKPTTDYLIQVEPADQSFPGWMIPRKYADFETLHEVLRRISVITGTRFTEAHAELPKWRVHTKASLREELERYLSDAVNFQPLAESEGMKRFLEKERGLSRVSTTPGKGFGWPTPDAFGKLGGDMMNALTRGPKQSGGSAGTNPGRSSVLGNVTGFVGGSKRASQSQSSLSRVSSSATHEGEGHNEHKPESTNGQIPMTDSFISVERESLESTQFSSPQTSSSQGMDTSRSSLDRRVTSPASDQRPSSSISEVEPRTPEKPVPLTTTSNGPKPVALSLEETLNLPPPPSEMPEDYSSPTQKGRFSTETFHSVQEEPQPTQSSGLQKSNSPTTTKSTTTSTPPPTTTTTTTSDPSNTKSAKPEKPESKPTNASATPDAPRKQPLTERETSVTIELVFAIITELYTLSSVWQIRRTLLSAAKTFLLRPGNPQITSIRNLLQTSLLDANLNDAGLAHHIYKLRENTLPTVEEMEAWKRDYPEKNEAEKEQLRLRARRLLVTRGMPQALTSVMGAAGSREALGKVFDCLQVPEISRGLIFGLLLQALRVVTH